LQAYRAPTDNDRHSPSGIGEAGWIDMGLDRMNREVKESGLINKEASSCLIKSMIKYTGHKGAGFYHYALYKIFADGTIAMRNLIQPVGPFVTLPRLGIRITGDSRLEKIRWFGRGPGESYPDRKSSALVGDYESTVSLQNEHYACPQEMGNKEDTRFLMLYDEDGEGFQLWGGALFSFSALHFTAEDLRDAKHDGQWKARQETILSVDYRQNGLGNSSCGGDVMEKYRLKPLEAELNIVLSPYSAKTSPYQTADAGFPPLPAIDDVFRVDHGLSV
jgi:beta-galactosidase